MDRQGKNGGTLHSYEKGQSGNPAGRPIKPNLISKILSELGEFDELEVCVTHKWEGSRPVVHQLSYKTHGNQCLYAIVAYRLMEMAVMGNYEAIRIILDRTEGHIPPPMNIGISENGPLVKVIIYQPKKAKNAANPDQSVSDSALVDDLT